MQLFKFHVVRPCWIPILSFLLQLFKSKRSFLNNQNFALINIFSEGFATDVSPRCIIFTRQLKVTLCVLLVFTLKFVGLPSASGALGKPIHHSRTCLLHNESFVHICRDYKEHGGRKDDSSSSSLRRQTTVTASTPSLPTSWSNQR